MLRQTQQQLKVTRLGDEDIFPARLGEVFELLGFFFFLYLVRIPRGHDINQIGSHPGRSLQLVGKRCRLGVEFFEEQALILDSHHTVQQRLKNIRDNLAAAGLGDDTSRKLVRSCVDVIDLDARKAPFKGR